MKRILTHNARNVEDVVSLLKNGGTFTCPTLPHYRYRPTQKAASTLIKAGMLSVSGKTDTSVNYVASRKFNLWLSEYTDGKTKLQPVKWAKQHKKAGVV